MNFEFKTPLLVLIAIYLIFLAAILINNTQKIDEYFNHIPTLKSFYNKGPALVLTDEYKAANTPLPYFIGAYTSKLLSIQPSLKLARSINLFFSFCSCMLFIYLMKEFNSRHVYLSAFIFLFYPYFLKPSLTYYMMIYGIFFLLLSILFFYKDKIVLSGVSASLGILSQQFLVALPAAFLFYLIYQNVREQEKLNVKQVVLYFIPMIIPSVLFFYWGGLTHPNYASIHKISFEIYNLTSLFTIIGFFFLPFSFLHFRKINVKRLSIFAVISVVIVIFFSPEWHYKGGEGKITGLTFHIIELFNFAGSFVPFIIKSVLCFSGLIVLNYALFQTDRKVLFLSILVIGFVLVFLFNTMLAERHIVPLMAILYLIILNGIENKKIFYIWLPCQIILGASYAYYLLYLTHDY